MNIGIYGGSFDPVHNGHIKLARFMLGALQLDKLLIVPAFRSPLKEENASDASDRLNMCRLAFTDPRFEVTSMEIDRGGKSYTAETLNEIKKIYGNERYYLIIGSDQLLHFNNWYRFPEILSGAALCAVSRRGEDKQAELELFADKELRRYGRVLICDFEPLDISSTELRSILKNGGDAGEYLPADVKNYITDRGLYK